MEQHKNEPPSKLAKKRLFCSFISSLSALCNAYTSNYSKHIKTANAKNTKSLALKEESRATLGPSALVTTTRHVKTRDSLISVSTIVDWDRDAVALRIGVSGILANRKRKLLPVTIHQLEIRV